ncbi:MAG: hypothetical protein Aurels2KO_10470 [Aureliella sp.]
MFLGLNFGNGYLAVEVVDGNSKTIHLEIGQNGRVQIPAVDNEGTALSLGNRSLSFFVHDLRGAQLLQLADSSIERVNGNFTVAVNTATTQKKRTLRWRLMDVTGGANAELVQGFFAVY